MADDFGKILIAEDHEGFAEWMSEELRHAGFDVTICLDGDAAFRTAVSAPLVWYALITDFNMPKLNGIELMQALRSAGVEFKIVIMLSTIVIDSKEVVEFIKKEGIIGLDQWFEMSTLIKVITSYRAA